MSTPDLARLCELLAAERSDDCNIANMFLEDCATCDLYHAAYGALPGLIEEVERLHDAEDLAAGLSVELGAAEREVERLRETLDRVLSEHGEARYRDQAVTEARMLYEAWQETKATLHRRDSLILAMLEYKRGRDEGKPKDEAFVRLWLDTARAAMGEGEA